MKDSEIKATDKLALKFFVPFSYLNSQVSLLLIAFVRIFCRKAQDIT